MERRTSLSNKFSDKAEIAGPKTTLGKALSWGSLTWRCINDHLPKEMQILLLHAQQRLGTLSWDGQVEWPHNSEEAVEGVVLNSLSSQVCPPPRIGAILCEMSSITFSWSELCLTCTFMHAKGSLPNPSLRFGHRSSCRCGFKPDSIHFVKQAALKEPENSVADKWCCNFASVPWSH